MTIKGFLEDVVENFNVRRPKPRVERSLTLIVLLLAALTLSACAGKKEKPSALDNLNEAYTTAKTAIERQNYQRGIQIFEAMQSRYPFSDLSRQIQLELMYAYYKSGSREQAVDMADTFMRENPINPRVDYALYIKGLANFERSPSFIERWFHRKLDKRPPKDVQLSYSSLRRLVERYPASPYATDAEQRMVYLRNRLAAYETTVADYYLRRGAYVAAVDRAKRTLETYDGAASNKRTLTIMAKAYDKLGMTDLAADTRRVLETNFPGKS